jgi:hypothetical protein
MELRHLRYVVAVTEEGSPTTAAELFSRTLTPPFADRAVQLTDAYWIVALVEEEACRDGCCDCMALARGESAADLRTVPEKDH